MTIWNRRVASAALLGSSFFVPFAAHAIEAIVVSGLVGAQDDKSKELLALPQAEAAQVEMHDLLSVLKPTGTFKLDNSRNVEGMMFVTEPYQTLYSHVCRQDRVMLRYRSASRFDAAGKWLDYDRQPAGVESQPTYHVEQPSAPGLMVGMGNLVPVCDALHPGTRATWFSAPSDADAVRGANMFRMAEEEVKSGRLTPGPCDTHGADTCRQWIVTLDDPSKINSIKTCGPTTGDDACYTVSFGSVDMTISGTIPGDSLWSIIPTAIKSVRAETVITVME